MKKFLLFALVAVVSLLASCSRSQRFQGGNRKLYDTITVYSVDKIVETSGNKESFGTETYYLVATDKGAYRIDLYGIPAVIEYLNGESKETRINADVELGLIDSQYTGMVSSIIKAFSLDILVKRIYIPKGTKIAQMRIVEIPRTELVSGTVEKNTERGDGGFNSTGVK